MLRILIILLSIASAFIQANETGNEDVKGDGTIENPYQVSPTNDTIQLDGELSEQMWETSLMLTLPYEYWPGDNTPAPVRTEIYITHTKEHLYVGFKCFDPEPENIRAHYLERDKFWSDNDFVRIWLETFNDGQKAYAIGANPLGVQGDGIFTKGALSLTWDGIWDAAGKLQDWGYSVEFAIPFSQLTFKSVNGKRVWGISAGRGYPRGGFRIMNMIAWDKNFNTWPSSLPKFIGFEDIESSEQFEIIPTLTSAISRSRESLPDGDFSTLKDSEIGLTSRWAVTPDITLAGTINPDFSQVEADALQMDINEPFAIFYPEKRPFFMEGRDFFQTGINALHTRSFRSPNYGIKSLGKVNANSFGVYYLNDEITNLIIPSNRFSQSTTMFESNDSFVGRYRYELGAGDYAGVMLTNRQATDYYNRTIAVDYRKQITNKDMISFEAFKSFTKYPGDIANGYGQLDDEFSGLAYMGTYNHSAETYDATITYMDVGEGFRADMGFIPQVDFKHLNIEANYRIMPSQQTWYWKQTISYNYQNYYDHAGQLIKMQHGPKYDYEGPMHSNATLQYLKGEESFGDVTFPQDEIYWSVGFKVADSVEIELAGVNGDRIDYANLREGKRNRLEPSLTGQLGRHFQLSWSYIRENLEVDLGRLYTANIHQISADYRLDRRLSLLSTFQYVDYERNTSLYLGDIQPDTEHLFAQIIFSYKVNPRTVVHLGYSDNLQGTREFELTRNDHRLFLKLSYDWMM